MTDHDIGFAEFFHDVWGVPPHRWQTRLAAQVIADGRWPDVIDVPTGAGKTSAIDIAVYALSLRPDAFARRIAFVVDRRLIVDQTAVRAVGLAAALDERKTHAVAAVADRLLAMGSRGVALDVDRLRGGDQDGEVGAFGSHWLKWPDQPAVIVSTVDQFGSRLLFRGYGVSSRMRPIHAGLTGNDCLVVLDEVHLSTALAETLNDLSTELHPVRNAPRRWQVVQMSATPIGAVGNRFQLTRHEVSDGSELAQRVTASKRATLLRIGRPRQPHAAAWAGAINDLVDGLGLTSGVIGVVVNRVATAKAIGDALRDRRSAVLTGRMRPYERRSVEAACAALADPGRPQQADGVSIIVATQCIEVGADLSFDALITEVCPLSSLRQRFGRLDRRGTRAASGVPAAALVVGVEADIISSAPDPVYGHALRATWNALSDRFGDGEFEVGPLAADLDGFDDSVHVPHVPPAVLMPAHLDLLSCTNPEPVCAPSVDAFLHGFREDDTDVAVVWRSDVNADDVEMSQAALELLPPMNIEALAVPLSAVRRWLAGLAAGVLADVDTIGAGDADTVDDGRRAVRWRAGEPVELVHPRAIRPGDVLVVPTSYGGLDSGVWDPFSETEVRDIAGPVSSAMGRPVVRIGIDVGLTISAPTGAVTDDELDRLRDAVRSDRHAWPEWTRGLDDTRLAPYGPPGRVRWAVTAPRRVLSVSFDGADEANSFVGKRVTLGSHLAGVGEHAQRFGGNCGLPAHIVSDLRLAGEVHDIGKVDSRFQLMLEGDEIAAAMASEPIAKSRHQRRRWRGGYPDGMRHEYLSADMLATAGELLRRANDPDLVLHLVTTHHGNARPVARVVEDPEPQNVEYTVAGVGMTGNSGLLSNAVGAASLARFTSLTERYGWHGLAWLEAIFRLADHRQSEKEGQ